MTDTINRICRRCRENVTPEQVDCPFCGQETVTIDELADLHSAYGRCHDCLAQLPEHHWYCSLDLNAG